MLIVERKDDPAGEWLGGLGYSLRQSDSYRTASTPSVRVSSRTQLLILLALAMAVATSIGLQIDPGYRSPRLTNKALAAAEANRRLMCASRRNQYVDCDF
jgi:hypothetical protein